MAKVGFIGAGNMGTAMMQGMLQSGEVKASDMMVSDRLVEMLEDRKAKYGVQITANNCDVAKFAEVLILAVKPQFYETVIDEIKDAVREDAIVVSLAAGKTIDWICEQFEKRVKLIRTMPNTPCMVDAGMIGMCPNEKVTEEEVALVQRLCSSFAKTEVLAENLLDVVTAVSGSAPAYVFMFIEAMADAAVAGGMPRAQAYTFAAQAVFGSAKMVLDTKKHPGELKDMVCSPAGTTIQAVRVLEEKGLRSSVIEAMMKCLDVSRNM